MGLLLITAYHDKFQLSLRDITKKMNKLGRSVKYLDFLNNLDLLFNHLNKTLNIVYK